VRKAQRLPQKRLKSEQGFVRKNWKGRLRVALVYPNTYGVGMSNLGFHAVYSIFNDMDTVLCERLFLSEGTLPPKTPPVSLESQTPLSDFDIIAFSISFEIDFPNILEILHLAGIPFLAADRVFAHPLVIAGGVACLLNPEPIAEFIDCFLIGEAEVLLPSFIDNLQQIYHRQDRDKPGLLKHLAHRVLGAYIPAFYKPVYHGDQTLAQMKPDDGIPEIIERAYLSDLSQHPASTAILTPNTVFAQTRLIETGRGCPHGCRFCSAGFVYRPPRFKSGSMLKKEIEEGLPAAKKIGLVGAAISDLPEINKLCRFICDKNILVSFSSLRADALTPELIAALRQSKIKTATIAPDAGTLRLRKVINKNITKEALIGATKALVEGGIPNLKLYFMIGLPTETDQDIQGIIELCKEIKAVFLEASRPKKRIGDIAVSLNFFIPKPVTPFQWHPMEDIRQLKTKLKRIRTALKKVANIRIQENNQRRAFLQALFSRGDRRVAQLLLMAHKNRWNWARTLKVSPINPSFYVHRLRSADELLPWDFIDHGISKAYLLKEYFLAQKEQESAPCPMTECGLCNRCKRQPHELSPLFIKPQKGSSAFSLVSKIQEP
jgi:radical SAM family uncharacterized protein